MTGDGSDFLARISTILVTMAILFIVKSNRIVFHKVGTMSQQKVRRTKKPKKRREQVEPHFLDPEKREYNFNEVNLGYTRQDEVFVETMRCYTCRRPQCVQACPGNFDIRSMLVNIQEGNVQAAADLVHNFYCFSESFNRVCPAFCQDACIASKRGDAINILHIKRWLAENKPKPDDYYETAPATGIKIAIVGSGPAGLTAAHALAKMGHQVTIFEKQPVRGGMLAVGIPEYRLPKSILNREIDDLEKLGIEIKTGVAFGTDITTEELNKSGYKAILIAHGAHQPKWIGIPGEDKKGVFHAIDFLRSVALNQPIEIGERVAVIGGGDVAIDAVRVATRLGKEATLIYRRTRAEMPATEEEIEETENENIPIMFLRNPEKITGNQFVEGIELVKMELGPPDESGRSRPIPIPGSSYLMPVDTVIMAISQEPDVLDSDFELTRWNTFKVNESYMTNETGIFAAGDNVSGPKTVIEAIVQAKAAAKEIDSFVRRDQELEQPLFI